ncbi:MAG: protein kinase domain-containing protein [Planctomycetota bacterium]
MSQAEGTNNDRPGEEELPPTASFNQLARGSGSQIGQFRIERELGRGGAGVVYLAHDTRLDRSVAIKSLPIELMENPKVRSRFSREARVLASLNHPNIATIYEELEEADGIGYLILEYVPGQTLAERIAKGQLKLQEALSIAQQIAEAVAAAHEHDVIHRDLKPGNIKITPEGKIKVLDFGLAKAVGGEGLEEHSTITEPGRVIGTPAYMSPEQARGKPIDTRSDIFSFGCVLYEMLTGRIPFKGETISDTLANILQTEPNWKALPENIPVNIQVLLRRCLEKDPRRRLQHMGDVVIEIDETLNLTAAVSVVSAPAVGKPRSIMWMLGIVCSLAGLIVGLITAALFLSRPTTPSVSDLGPLPTQRLVIKLPENQTLALSRSTPLGILCLAVALSPDGSRLVYVADLGDSTQLFLRLMEEFEATPIPGTEGAFTPFFSPNGQSVGFFTKDKLKIVSLLGGEPVPLCDARNPRGASWSADGMIYFAEIEGARLSRVSAAGGPTEDLMATTEPVQIGRVSYEYPEILPGGKSILLSSRNSTMLLSLETRETKILLKDGYHARYVPTGHLVYAQAGALRAAPFDLTTLQVTGPSVPVFGGLLLESRHGTAQFALSNDGLLVYVPGGDTAKGIPAWVDRQGNVEPIPMPAQIYGTFSLSPDGKRLAIVVAGSSTDVYIYDVESGKRTRLTLEGNNDYPIWTPDGRRITFASNRDGQGHLNNIFWKPVEGSVDAELLHLSEYRLSPYSWLSNGKLLAFGEWPLAGGGGGIWILSLEEPREPELIIDTEFSEWGPAFSPDGRWIAYTSDKDGKYQIYVQPYPAMDRVWQISDDFGEEPIWSPKGDELFYRNGDKWMVVSISTEPEFAAGMPQVLFEGPYNNVPGISYDVAPDGRRFLVLQPVYDDSQVGELHVVTNWFEELKRLVPVDKNQ